jgi:hypothetical protein
MWLRRNNKRNILQQSGKIKGRVEQARSYSSTITANFLMVLAPFAASMCAKSIWLAVIDNHKAAEKIEH